MAIALACFIFVKVMPLILAPCSVKNMVLKSATKTVLKTAKGYGMRQLMLHVFLDMRLMSSLD